MKRGARALTLIVVLIIACLVAWPIVRIANAAKAGQEAARASFLDIRRQAINALAAPEQASGQNWQAVARTAWSANPRLLSVVVSRRDDGVLFAMPAASMYYQETKAGQAPSYNFPKSVISSFQGPLASGMMIETLFTTLSQQDVFIALRDSSIAVLALILIAAGWLLASPADAEQLSRHANADSMYRQPLDADSDSIASKYLSGLEQARVDAQANAGAPTDVSEQPEAGAQTKAGAPVKTGALDANKQDSAQAVPMDGLSMQTENHGKELRCKDLPGADLAGPKGLFDPETGLGWESYLRERLSAELKRSASFEQDLCLLLAALDDTARGQEAFALFAKTAQEFFTFKDLSFIFGDNGVAIILPNMDVDHAIRMSEELLKKLTFLMKGKDGSMSYLELFMGISSRSGRLVDADRLVGEAFAALNKARDERDTHIMAFRPDPEKFRAYLANS